ncbi:hypothetical protein FB446DRAFT_756640, partial [Lentinula raphanica]
MRLTPPLLHSSSKFLRSLLTLSVFSCSFSPVMSAIIPPTVAMPRNTHLHVRAPPAVELKLTLHFPPWPSEIQFGAAYMSI